MNNAVETISLCHWTTPESAKSIAENGFNTELVYFSNTPAASKHFGGDNAVAIWVDVPVDAILIDFDDRAMSIESANDRDVRDWDINEWFENWHSFAVQASIVNGCL